MSAPIELHHGDCREVLASIPAGFADACITDPPYGETSLDWDVHCKGWLQHVARALKPTCSIWVFGSMRFLIPVFAEMAALGFKYSQDVVWEKHNGSSFLNDRFRRVHEHAVLFYRGPWRDVHHDTQFTLGATQRVVRKSGKPRHWHGEKGATTYVSEAGGRLMQRSVIFARNDHRRSIHPTQKPLDLLLPLVRYSCPPGGVVLDCFAGSCGTGLATKYAGGGRC